MNTLAKTPFILTRSRKTTQSAILATLGAGLLAACSPQAADYGEPPLAGADIGGDFTLTSSTGETVRWADFRGQYAVVYFGYAFCPDVCPTTMQRTVRGLKVLAERDAGLAAKMQPVFITVDPARDTREVVGEFASAFSEDLIGLTGTPEQVKAAADAFAVYYKLGEPAEEGGGYLVDHTDIVYLFDPEGKPLAMLPANEGPEAVADEIQKWAS
jgi:protein SCO1/2